MRYRMKQWIAAALALIFIILPGCVGAEILGFGFVNNTDVAVRREPGGKVIGRLPEDTCVWIKDTRTDKKGVLWYQINAGMNRNYTNLDYTGWMKAEFIDAGEKLWHDVVSVSALGHGMIVVRNDGTAEIAGRMIPPMEGRDWVSVRGRAAADSPIIQAAAYWGNDYAFLTADGRVHGVERDDSAFIDVPLRLLSGFDFLFGISRDNQLKSVIRGVAEGLEWIWPEEEPDTATLSQVTQMVSTDRRVLMRTEDGRILVAGWGENPFVEPEPDWSAWSGMASIAAGEAYIREGESNLAVVAGIREDGSVEAFPSLLAEMIGDWTEMAEIKTALHGIVGLKRDGTAVSIGWGRYPALDVSAWTDVIAIANGNDYCAGLKRDGTLVFAGEHIFMNEGHNRK